MLTAIVAKSKNNSDLLSVVRRNEDQFQGTGTGNWSSFLQITKNKSKLFIDLATMAVSIDTVDCSARLFTHFPALLFWAPAFKQWDTYSSQTMSCLVACWSCDVICCKKYQLHSPLHSPGRFWRYKVAACMLTIAAGTIKNGASIVSPEGLCWTFTIVRSFRKIIKSDFVPPLRAPICMWKWWWARLVLTLKELIKVTITNLRGNVKPGKDVAIVL